MQIAEVVRIAAALGRDSCRTVGSLELRQANVDMSVVAALVRAGRWTWLWRGMYYCAPPPAGPIARAHAAVKFAGERGPTFRVPPPPVLSGLFGATALGLPWVPAVSRLHVLVGRDVQRRSNSHVLIRRTWDLADVETWSWAGVPVAEATRLVVDGARECRTLRDVRGLALGAIGAGWTSPAAVRSVLDRGATAKTALLRRALLDAERGAASPPEAELVDCLVGLGLPFVVNAEIWVDGALVGVFDIYLLGTGIGVEVDSLERHGEAATLQATLGRHERSSAAGLSLLHLTPGTFRADPDAFLQRLLAAVASRRAAGLSEPPGMVVRPRGPVLR